MGHGRPLDDPKLREVDRLLDQMRVTDAQHMLAEIGEIPGFEPAVAYLTTRVLHIKGRIDARSAAERIGEILKRVPDFPEAAALLERLRIRQSNAPHTVPARPIPEPPPDPATVAELPSGRPSLDALPLPNIPKAPGLPDFHENRAPPSYIPIEGEDEDIARLRSKSLLTRDAGRYSEHPRRSETVRDRSVRPVPSERAARETIGHTPEHRSDPANRRRMDSAPISSAPSSIELASWIDAGRYADVISALDKMGPGTPEQALLRARALSMQGGTEKATAVLSELLARGPLDAELMASCARLYIELGDPTRALVLAEQALRADPDRPMGRLTYILSAVRTVRRNSNAPLMDRADILLRQMDKREGPLPSLFLALRACVYAGTNQPELALTTAQRALGLDPNSVDAIAAIAEAAARMGRMDDSKEAIRRLAELSPREADAIARRLTVLGLAR